MGAGASDIAVRKFQEKLTKGDYSGDDQVWLDVFEKAPARGRDLYLDTRLILRIEGRQPNNLMKATELALLKCQEVAEMDGEILDGPRNALALSLVMFSWTVTLLAERKCDSPCLRRIVDEKMVMRFCESVCKCMGKEGLFDDVGLRLVQALLRMLNLGYFTRFHEHGLEIEADAPGFPGVFFVNKTFQLLLREKQNAPSLEFHAHVALLTRLGERAWPWFAEADYEPYVKRLADTMDRCVATVLLLAVMNSKKMIEALCDTGMICKVMMALVNYGKRARTSDGVYFGISIVVEYVHILVQNGRVVQSLNALYPEQQPGNSDCTYADIIIEALFDLCNSESLERAFAAIFLALSHHLRSLSAFVSRKILDVLQIFSQETTEEKVANTTMLLQGLAMLIQKPEIDRMLAFVMAQRTAIFVSMKGRSEMYNEPLAIIMTYLTAVRSEVLKSKIPAVTVEEMAKVVASINIAQLFPTPTRFSPVPFDFHERLSGTWDTWSEVLYSGSDKFFISLLHVKDE